MKHGVFQVWRMTASTRTPRRKQALHVLLAEVRIVSDTWCCFWYVSYLANKHFLVLESML